MNASRRFLWHRYKGDIYERIVDSDVVVRSASRLAEICIRKQGLYTEQRVYKHVSAGDLKLEMLDGDAAISLRDAIVREVVANCLVHREFTSPYPARQETQKGTLPFYSVTRP